LATRSYFLAQVRLRRGKEEKGGGGEDFHTLKKGKEGIVSSLPSRAGGKGKKENLNEPRKESGDLLISPLSDDDLDQGGKKEKKKREEKKPLT